MGTYLDVHCTVYVQCIVQFTKELFWNFKECQVGSMEAHQDKQMSEKKFFPNVAPSPGSGTPKSRKNGQIQNCRRIVV